VNYNHRQRRGRHPADVGDVPSKPNIDGALGRKGAGMMRKTSAAFIIGATLVLGIASASAGPCSADIAQFENTVRNSAKNPDAGPMGPQTLGAQLGHEPTPESINQAEAQAQTRFEATLAQAKAFDAQGKSAECAQALSDAKLMFRVQ
jgi:hypothetical protein